MANANSGVPRGQVINGARGFLIANGVQVGYVTNVSYQQAVNQQPVNAIDNILTEEFVPTDVSYTGSIGRIEVFGSTSTQAGLTVPLDQIYTAPVLNLALVDRPNGKVYLTFENVKFTSSGIDFSKGTQTVLNLGFVCILARDQNGVIAV